MRNRRVRWTERRKKSLPEPWLPHAEPFNPNAPSTPQPWNHYWPSESSMQRETWNQHPFQPIEQWPTSNLNQQSTEYYASIQNELPLEVWDRPSRVPFIQQPPFPWQTVQRPSLLPIPVEINNTSNRSATPFQHKITTPLHSLNRHTLLSTPTIRHENTAPSHSLHQTPLLSTPNREPRYSNRTDSVRSSASYPPLIGASSYSKGRAPLLATPSCQTAAEPYNSSLDNATIHSTRRKFYFSVQDSSPISDSSKKRKRSPVHSNCYSSIATNIESPAKKQVFREIELKENGALQIHVRGGNSEEAKEEEVQYLYSVDNKKEKLIEFVDLSKDSQAPQRQNLLHTSINSITEDNVLRFDEHCNTPLFSFKKKEIRYNEGRNGNQKVHCNRCLRSYENLYNSKYDLFIAKCGHLFCVACLKKFTSNKCLNCGKAIMSFSKIVI